MSSTEAVVDEILPDPQSSMSIWFVEVMGMWSVSGEWGAKAHMDGHFGFVVVAAFTAKPDKRRCVNARGIRYWRLTNSFAMVKINTYRSLSRKQS